MASNCPLAITCTQTGRASETFIRRHVQSIMPGQTIVLSDFSAQAPNSFWEVDCPQFSIYGVLKHAEPSVMQRVVRAADRKIYGRLCSDSRLATVKDVLRQHQVKVILGEYLDVSFPWLAVARELQIPFFAHAHGGDVHVLLRNRLWRKRYEQLAFAQGIITPDENTRQKLISIGLSADKISVIPCGVDVPADIPHRLESDVVRCVAVGRLVLKKGPLKTLEAFRMACRQRDDLHLDLVGAGPLFEHCQRFVESAGLTSRVKLHGALPHSEALAILRNSHIFLQHSMRNPDSGDEEGSPVAVKEAMAAALPVVATNHAGIPQFVIEGETGFLVDEGDVKAMSNRLLLLAESTQLREQLGNAGWKVVKERGSWQHECSALRNLMGLELFLAHH